MKVSPQWGTIFSPIFQQMEKVYIFPLTDISEWAVMICISANGVMKSGIGTLLKIWDFHSLLRPMIFCITILLTVNIPFSPLTGIPEETPLMFMLLNLRIFRSKKQFHRRRRQTLHC